MTKNNAIFYVENEADKLFQRPTNKIVIRLISKMWIRYYDSDGNCQILQTSSDVERVGIDSDQTFESLKAIENRLVLLEMPFFIVYELNSDSRSEPIYYFDEALSYADNLAKESE
jgi:hypothetical protein